MNQVVKKAAKREADKWRGFALMQMEAEKSFIRGAAYQKRRYNKFLSVLIVTLRNGGYNSTDVYGKLLTKAEKLQKSI